MLMRPRLQQILDTVGEVKREVRQFLTLESAQIRLGIMCTVGPTRFTGLLADFRMRFPGISLELIEGMPTTLAEKLEKGEIDIAVMASADGYPERLDLKLLYRERFLLACPTGHRFTRQNAVRMEEVHGENYLLRLNCEYQNNIEDLLRQTGGDVRVCYQSEREDWIQNMVAGGLGICFIPEFSAVLPGLELRPVIDPDVWRDINLVTMSGRRMSPALLSFTKAVRDYPWPASRFEMD